MIVSAARFPGLEDGSVTLAVAQQIAEPSEASHDPRLEPQVLQRALEEQLHGCRVSRVLGVGGVSACFAARMESFGRVAFKVSLRGSAGPHSWVAEAAEVRNSRQYAKQRYVSRGACSHIVHLCTLTACWTVCRLIKACLVEQAAPSHVNSVLHAAVCNW